MFNVQFVSGSAAVTDFRTNTLITPPAGIQNGDLLVLLFYIEVETPTPPTGFVPFTNLGPLAFPVTNTKFWAWRKRANNEAGNYTITHAATTTNAVLLVYRGVDADFPEDVAPSTNSGNNNPNMLANGINVQTPGSMVIYVAAMFFPPAGDLAVPGGNTPVFTQRFDCSEPPIIFGAFGLFICDGPMLTAGPTGNKTVSGGPSVDDWVTTLIALRPFAPLSIDDRTIEGASWEDDRTIETANWEDDRTFKNATWEDFKQVDLPLITMTAEDKLNPIAKGDARTVRRTFKLLPSGVTISKAWLTIKKREADLDAQALILKDITTTLTSKGQITDASTSDGQIAMFFEIAKEDTAQATIKVNVDYPFDIQVLRSTGQPHTLVKGTVRFFLGVTDANN